MQITAETLAKIVGKKANANMSSVAGALTVYGPGDGLDLPHRLAHFIAQVAHESGGFHYDRELWGPTPAQERYDTRTDLGNTPERDGDGKKNAGRGPIQLTGGHNIRAFYSWCVDQGYKPPNFPNNPDMINTDPWEGLSAIWYWTVGNPTGRSLNRFADANDIETITKRINGGLNGFDDRLNWYTRTALVLLGYGPTQIKEFQRDAQIAGLLPADVPGKASQVDGDAGPKTRSALHMSLAKLSQAPAGLVSPAPVVEKVETAVVPAGAEKTLWQRITAIFGAVGFGGAGFASLFTNLDQTGVFILLGVGAVALLVLYVRGERIASRAKEILKAFDGVGS